MKDQAMRLADRMAEARFCEGVEEGEGGSERRAERAFQRYQDARRELFDLLSRAPDERSQP